MSLDGPPQWTFSTWGRWRAREIWDSGFFTVRFDTFGDGHFDYYALVRSTGNRLVGTLHRDYARRDDRSKGKLRVTRPDRRSVRIEVPFRKMRFEQQGRFRWKTATTWTSARCSEATCLDRAPDSGAIGEPRGPVPSPTITPTPTPSL